jgi:hypothetical protein
VGSHSGVFWCGSGLFMVDLVGATMVGDTARRGHVVGGLSVFR